jgi:glycosyltransferase involved in cell wall biosynthesis
MGTLPREDYRNLLRISTLHVYLTVPFVPSWSLVEAMACGCGIVASDTPGTREILARGSALDFVDHRDWRALEKVVAMSLSGLRNTHDAKLNARKRAETSYSLHRLLPQWKNLAMNGGDFGTPKLAHVYGQRQ